MLNSSPSTLLSTWRVGSMPTSAFWWQWPCTMARRYRRPGR
ncbi:MAG TPA: hypothetical protein VEQ60_32505 [Longimicrobium sp.]|nr:hypothetical protein [Longimicrobium sp.]